MSAITPIVPRSARCYHDSHHTPRSLLDEQLYPTIKQDTSPRTCYARAYYGDCGRLRLRPICLYRQLSAGISDTSINSSRQQLRSHWDSICTWKEIPKRRKPTPSALRKCHVRLSYSIQHDFWMHCPPLLILCQLRREAYGTGCPSTA